jgi:hypothetical protein
MAFRLNDAAICGELINTRKNSVHGWLGLRGTSRRLIFELTGNCDPDLTGRHIRFELREPPKDDEGEGLDDSNETAKAALARFKLDGLVWRHIGPTGTMTADHKVRAADCPVEELYMRCKLGEPPPTEWKRCLYLEWYSQNGRVVLEMVDPIIEFVEPDGKTQIDDNEVVVQAREEEPPPEGTGGLSITAIYRNEDGEVEVRDETPLPDEEEDSTEDGSDPYKLIPDELQRHLDAQAREMDRSVRSEEENETIRELELMDELIEKGEGQPVGTLFDDVVKLPPPDSLSDEQAEVELKGLLIRLAMLGIALDMCEHYTARDAYRLLVEHICREQKAYPELRGTEWVQHFSTWEFCEKCEAELDRQYEESQRREKDTSLEDDAGDQAGDDEMPF